MPSQILHVLFGEDCIAALGDPFPMVNEHRGAFILGCQGPDIFYHNRRTRPLALEYGSLLHRRDYGVFCERLLNAPLDGRCDGGARDAYAFGFLTHALLDRSCHPYIVYKAGGGVYHPFFERILDVLMLRHLRGQDAASWEQSLLTETCAHPPAGIKESLVHALTAAFPEKTRRDLLLVRRIDNAFIDSARYYALSDPAHIRTNGLGAALTRRSIALIHPRNLPENIDFLNMKEEPWYYPYCVQAATVAADTRSFPRVYADSLAAAAVSLPLCMNDARHIGNGSLSIQNEEGKPCAPNRTSALPLDAVLQEHHRVHTLPQ